MAPPPDHDHDCGWKVFAKDLVEKMAELEAKMAAMEALHSSLDFLDRGDNVLLRGPSGVGLPFKQWGTVFQALPASLPSLTASPNTAT
jgi:hypothetical protein